MSAAPTAASTSSAPRPRPATRTRSSAPSTDVSVGIRNAGALAAGFGSAGVTIAVPLRRMPYGIEFYVRYPDGYVLGFVEPPPATK